MIKYYTRVCNFYYGNNSKKVKKKQSIPLHGNKLISFDTIEILTRKNIRRVHIKEINKIKSKVKKILYDIKNITKKSLKV